MTRTVGLHSFGRKLKTLLTSLVAAALVVPALPRAADSPEAAPPTGATAPGASAPAPSNARKPATHRAATMNQKAKDYYQGAWGVDRLKVSYVASGTLIRFTYRVSEPAQAAVLTDRNATPVLYSPRTRAMLSVPTMEKIGQLRQTGKLVAGQEYWIAFSNKGNLVKPGDRVNVAVGRFHADGLVVESSGPTANPQHTPTRNAS